MVNGHFYLTTNFQVRVYKPVESMTDNPLVGILYRHHAKICLGGLHLGKNIINTGKPKRLY